MTRSLKLFAVASKGGHWNQLMAIKDSFAACDVTYGATDPHLADDVEDAPFVELRDYNKSDKLNMIAGFFETLRVMRRLRPDVVVSTGAAPGLLCLTWGRLLGAQTIWIDSIANTEKLSLSGRLACRVAHTVLTQWEHLAADNPRVSHWGSVI